jgi:hypothetical protein
MGFKKDVLIREAGRLADQTGVTREGGEIRQCDKYGPRAGCPLTRGQAVNRLGMARSVEKRMLPQ